ncbi:hypothetical protein C8R44DRAFT_895433 [Mycena epipterygia]|nr:hypothetical protein C8R44DRAFT_895433 [Mycena epipterygia]
MTAQVYHGTDRLGTRPPASAAPAPTTSSSTSRGDAYPAFGYIRPTNTFPPTRSPPVIPPDDRPSSQLGWAAGADAVRGIMTFCVPLSPCVLRTITLYLLRAAPPSAHHHYCPSPHHPPSPCSPYTPALPRPAPRVPPSPPSFLLAPALRRRRPEIVANAALFPRYDGCPAPHSGDEMQPVDLPIVFLVSPCVVPISARVYVYVSFAQALKWFFGRA